MDALAFIFIFFLGTLIGSFLNVVIYRFGSGKSISRGRSICMSCNRTLRWYELIPVFSFLIQRGRCRSCASKISHQYPIVEIISGFVFALIAFHFRPLLAFSNVSYITLVSIVSLLFCLMIVIAVYDLRHKIIPDKLSYAFAIISFVALFINYSFVGSFFVVPSMWTIFAGPILSLPFGLIWLLSRGRAMGLGDAKLMLGIGWMVGISQGTAVIIISFWLGAIVSLLLLAFRGREITRKTEIPFAPFLIVGTAISFFLSIDIFSIISWFQFI